MFGKRKKRKKVAHQLTVGVRTQLCKECKGFEARICTVHDKPALFHQWSQEDRVYLKINCFVKPEVSEELVRRFREDGVVAGGCTTETERHTFALVEYPDGTVDKVRPESVRFLCQEA